MILDPDGDEWFETEVRPDFIHTLPGTYDTLTDLASKGVIDLNLGTVWGAWSQSWSGVVQDTNRRVNPSTTSGNIKTTTTTISTEQRVGQVRSGIRTSLVPNEVRKSIGNRVIGTSFVPLIRPQTIRFTATGMKPNTRVYAFFDGIDVNEFVTPGSIKELSLRLPSESYGVWIEPTSNAGAALTTDSKGEIAGLFNIPTLTTAAFASDSTVALRQSASKKKEFTYDKSRQFRTGRRTFRLTSNAANSLTGDIFTSAETDFVAKGLKNTVQGTIVSTREAKFAKNKLAEDTVITKSGSRTEEESLVIEQRIHSDPNENNTDVNYEVDNRIWTHYGTDVEAPFSTVGLDKTGQIVSSKAWIDTQGRVQGNTYVAPVQETKQKDAQTNNAKLAKAMQKYGSRSSVVAAAPTSSTSNTKVTAAKASTNYGNAVNLDRGRHKVKKFGMCGPGYGDPVAQSFLVTTPGGVFIPSIDLFFSTKSTTCLFL